MADEEQEQDEAAPAKSGGLGGVILFAVIGLVSAGGGFAVPFFFPSLVGGETGASETPKPPSPAFVPFGESVVNLDEGRLNRYLRVNITLQVNDDEVEDVTKEVEKKKAILKNWLLSNLSDKAMEEIRGAAGQNRLRREIQNHFNSVLFTDGYERIHDVLFEEFNVQ